MCPEQRGHSFLPFMIASTQFWHSIVCMHGRMSIVRLSSMHTCRAQGRSCQGLEGGEVGTKLQIRASACEALQCDMLRSWTHQEIHPSMKEGYRTVTLEAFGDGLGRSASADQQYGGEDGRSKRRTTQRRSASSSSARACDLAAGSGAASGAGSSKPWGTIQLPLCSQSCVMAVPRDQGV